MYATQHRIRYWSPIRVILGYLAFLPLITLDRLIKIQLLDNTILKTYLQMALWMFKDIINKSMKVGI